MNLSLPYPIFRDPLRVVENLRGSEVVLTTKDLTEIDEVFNKHQVKGDRYYGTDAKTAHLWG